MRGHYLNHTATTDAVEIATALHKEQCELRLARIMNGAEPSHQNGHVTPKKQPVQTNIADGTKR
jgi:hypothetical protein